MMKKIFMGFVWLVIGVPYHAGLLICFLFIMLVNFVYEKVHKSNIASQTAKEERLYREVRDLKGEITRIKQEMPLFKEVAEQLLNGKVVLGIHRIKTNRNFHDSKTGDWLPEIRHFYYMYEKRENSDTFFIRAYYAGQIQEYLIDRPYFINAPEDHSNAWVFRLEGSLRSQDMYIHQVDTDFKYQKVGIASIGFEHLKQIALQKGIKKISGKMDYKKDRTILQNFYRNRGFQITISETNTNDRFYLFLDGVVPMLKYDYTSEHKEKWQIGGELILQE